MTNPVEIPQKKEQEKYYEKIISDSKRRDLTTDTLLRELTGKDPREVINRACRAAGIEELKEKESFTQKILLLQNQKLKFELKDNRFASDGILGPYTLEALKQTYPVFKDFIDVSEKFEKKREEIKEKTPKKLLTEVRPGLAPKPEKSEDKKEKDSTTVELSGKNFIEKWYEIQKITDKEKLLALKTSVILKPNDPLVRLPNQKNIALRSGAALRFALFQRYAYLQGYKIYASSGFRTYQEQVVIWNRTLKAHKGDASSASAIAAPPGTSPHHTGGAVDISIYKDGNKIKTFVFNKKFIMDGKRKRKETREEHEARMKAEMEKTKDFSGLRNAVEVRKLLDEVLKASYFLDENYTTENWHWNIGRRNIYKRLF